MRAGATLSDEMGVKGIIDHDLRKNNLHSLPQLLLECPLALRPPFADIRCESPPRGRARTRRARGIPFPYYVPNSLISVLVFPSVLKVNLILRKGSTVEECPRDKSSRERVTFR